MIISYFLNILNFDKNLNKLLPLNNLGEIAMYLGENQIKIIIYENAFLINNIINSILSS